MSSLVRSRWNALQMFADTGGMKAIETAMTMHTSETSLQTKGIRALASGILWPEDIQKKSGFEPKRYVDVTKRAMSAHLDSAELQGAALDALSKYLDKLKLTDEVKADGGEELV